ncbi:FISUMP domain-containing protein [uncultured Fibrobacter sp.]|uniref:FISUMP domain-containing protein n=1 Tax=uncultured Fibrobacter sp. TaxID=261512 RepID=UPI0025D30BE3|nr:FISUMP domain-containing protein [uncultured Fibrobacter sp.]
MKKNVIVASGIAASFALLVACGDEVTEVTNVSEMVSLDTVKKFKELPKCEEETEGSIMYVKDSAKVYVCTGDGWTRMNGKDGEKGDKGDKGANGAAGDDGASCTAKQTKDKTGFDIVCDGKTVGTVKNGEDGKEGEKGEKGADGENGTSCSAKANKDKTGFDILCGGKTVGTIKNGEDGEDGDACTLTEDENGQVVVKCGEESVTLFKASCGTGSYDPATQFCANDMNVYPLCHKALEGFEQSLNADGTYDVESYFCDVTDLLVSLCNAKTYDFTTQFCAGYDFGAVPRCHKEPEGLGQLSEDGVYTRTSYFCDANDSLVALCGDDTYDTELQYCDSSGTKPRVVALCSGQSYELETHMCVDGQIKEAIACCIPEGQNSNWCNGHASSRYDIRKQFCDTRDGRPYKYVDVIAKNDSGNVVYSETWMAENLNYANTEEGESDCYGGNSSNCDADGRLYTWNAALSYCPDGWDLPTKQQYTVLFDAVNKYGISYSFLDQKAGYKGVRDGWASRGRSSLLWTADGDTTYTDEAWRVSIRDSRFNNIGTNNKVNLESVICIKHK